MDIRAVAFDVNGTLVKILADDDEERIFRAAAHFLTYQGIDLHRHELREIYFRIMKEQLRASPERYPNSTLPASGAASSKITRRNSPVPCPQASSSRCRCS